MSWQSVMVNGLLRMGKWQVGQQDVQAARALLRLTLKRLADMQVLPSSVHYRSETINGVPCEWVWVDETASSRGVVEYLHGGGFIAGSPASHRDLAWRLSRASGRRVLMVDYRLAPEHVYPAQLDDTLAVYEGLLARGFGSERIALAGDSAGANLALVCALACVRRLLPKPAAVLVFSPWADLTHAGDSIAANAASDTLIPVHLLEDIARLYHADASPLDPLISPVFADFQGFPPLAVHVAAGEVLLDDSLRIVARAQAARVSVEHRIWPKVPHAFPVFAQWLPEGRAALRQGGLFLQNYLAPEGEHFDAGAAR